MESLEARRSKDVNTRSVLVVEDLSVTRDDRIILQPTTFELAGGESLAIVGPTGSGKTTLLWCILGLTRPSVGTVRVAGHNLNDLSVRELTALRASRMGMVFQNGELLIDASPLENVVLPALIAGRHAQEAEQSAAELLDLLRIPRGIPDCYTLSGGERQRIALARALINTPPVLLADEPTGSLDPATRDEVAELVFGAPAQWGCALVVVTHDEHVASLADSVMDLSSSITTM